MKEGSKPQNNLLSYSTVGNVIVEDGREWLYGHREICPYCRTALADLGSFHMPAMNIAQSAKGETICMACGTRGAVPRTSGPHKYEETITFWHPMNVSPIACLFSVCVCENCGWWFAIQNADQCNDGYTVVAAGILETFDLSSATIPLEVLQSELSRHIGHIHGVHPKRMEDLVASILRGVHDCQVHQLGYSRDGGIDLILLDGDTRVAVQVKRREARTKSELVMPVREFLAAGLLNDYRNLMFVTSAEEFSKGAKKEAERAVTKKLVNAYELIALNEFASLLRTVTSPAWYIALQKAVKRGKSPSIPDPYTYIQQ